MEIKKYGPEHLEEYITTLDFGVGRFVGAVAEYGLHVPVIDTEILQASIEELGSSEFAFSPGATVVSKEVFDTHGCAFLGEDGERCDTTWENHTPRFIIQVELRHACTSMELLQAWHKNEHLVFVRDFDSVEFIGDHRISKAEGGDDMEEG